tara:strand:+ start:3318 stop:3992 length:675 start_codon:yes stop_codon:yes gene_type:complete
MKIKFNEQEEELVGGPNSPERRESRARQNFRNKATQWTNEVLYILKRMHRLTDRTNYAAAEGELQQVITAIRDEVERLQATFDNGGPVGFALREDYNMKIKKNGKVIKLKESDLKKIVKRVLKEQEINTMDTPQPPDNTRVDPSYLTTPPDFKVSKPLPDCAKIFEKQAIEDARKRKDFRVGAVTFDIGSVSLKVVTGPVPPGYEGIYLIKDGETEQFCKFNLK